MMEPHYTRENLAGVLRRHGISPTHQRIEIAYALFSRGEHLSADQILAIVNDRHSETSKATVYNTLNLFLGKKLIREVIVDPNKEVYQTKTPPHPCPSSRREKESSSPPSRSLIPALLPRGEGWLEPPLSLRERGRE